MFIITTPPSQFERADQSFRHIPTTKPSTSTGTFHTTLTIINNNKNSTEPLRSHSRASRRSADTPALNHLSLEFHRIVLHNTKSNQQSKADNTNPNRPICRKRGDQKSSGVCPIVESGLKNFSWWVRNTFVSNPLRFFFIATFDLPAVKIFRIWFPRG